MQMKWTGVGNAFMIDPPLRRIRVRSWAVDDTGDAPKLVYVYNDARTQNEQADAMLTVYWDGIGGASEVRNDHRVTWLDEHPARDGGG